MHTEPKTQAAKSTAAVPRKAWIAPTVTSHDAVEITKSVAANPGDFLSSAS